MSSEREYLFSNMCRLCIQQTNRLVNLKHNVGGNPPSSINIFDLIERFTTIKISPSDNLPQKICRDCVKTLNSMLQFQNKCKRSDVALQKMQQNLDSNDNQPTIKIEALEDHDTQENVSDAVPNNLVSELDSNHENDFKFRYENATRTYGSNQNNDPESESVQRSDEPLKVTTTAVERVPCHICGKMYSSKSIQMHVNTHYALRPYECKVDGCTSTFTSHTGRSSHIRIVHTKTAKKISCDVCGRAFIGKTNLKRHRSYHFDAELPCKICEKLFKNEIALKKHMMVHTQERKYQCDYCKKKFQTRYTIRVHMRVHTQDKPYLCSCGAAFAYKCLLKTHSEKCHKQKR